MTTYQDHIRDAARRDAISRIMEQTRKDRQTEDRRRDWEAIWDRKEDAQLIRVKSIQKVSREDQLKAAFGDNFRQNKTQWVGGSEGHTRMGDFTLKDFIPNASDGILQVYEEGNPGYTFPMITLRLGFFIGGEMVKKEVLAADGFIHYLRVLEGDKEAYYQALSDSIQMIIPDEPAMLPDFAANYPKFRLLRHFLDAQLVRVDVLK